MKQFKKQKLKNNTRLNNNKMNNNEKFLNDEIILGILLELNYNDFNKASKTNRQFNRVCKENKRRLLKYFIYKEFGVENAPKIPIKFWHALLIEYTEAGDMILNVPKRDFYKMALTERNYELTQLVNFSQLKVIIDYYHLSDPMTLI